MSTGEPVQDSAVSSTTLTLPIIDCCKLCPPTKTGIRSDLCPHLTFPTPSDINRVSTTTIACEEFKDNYMCPQCNYRINRRYCPCQAPDSPIIDLPPTPPSPPPSS